MDWKNIVKMTVVPKQSTDSVQIQSTDSMPLALNGIFHRNRANKSKICMEAQKTE